MWKKLFNLPFNVVNHQTIIIDNSIYIIGGYKNSESMNYEKITVFVICQKDKCVRLNCNTYSWNCLNETSLTLLNNSIEPFDCYGHTVVKWRNVGILFGGCSTNSSSVYSLTKIYLFVPNNQYLPSHVKCSDCLQKNYWVAVDGIVGNIPPKRDGHSVAIWRDNMFLFGGLLGSEVLYLNF